MIKHIVFFRIKSEKKEEDLENLKHMIENLKNTIPGILSIEAGINISPRETAYDIALVSEFENETALKEYAAHPEHQKLIARLHELNRELAVVDYVV